jgi:hypothetical protein
MPMGKCRSAGCNNDISKDGHYLCYACWTKKNKTSETTQKQTPEKGLITATKIAEHYSEKFKAKLSGQKMNSILNELGWIAKPPYGQGGWIATKMGKKMGGTNTKSKSGQNYVKYPPKIKSHRGLTEAVSAMLGKSEEKSESSPGSTSAHSSPTKTNKMKTRDGHYVRSRGEMLIDNFLYSVRIAHAYEQELILGEKTMIPDFIAITPKGNVYIEFWGLEGQPDYDSRRKEKIKLYEKNELELINVSPEHLDNLDAYLSRKLSVYGVKTAF